MPTEELSRATATWTVDADSKLATSLEELAAIFRDQSTYGDPVEASNRIARGLRNFFGDEGMISVSLRGGEPGQYRVMRMLHQDGVSLPGLTDNLYAGADAPFETGGIIGEIIKYDRPVIFSNVNITDDPVLGGQLAPYRMMYSVPVYDKGQALNFAVFINTNPNHYDERNLQQHILAANLIGNATNSKRMLIDLKEAHRWIQREVDEIADIQRALLPSKLPEVPGLECSGFYDTFDRAGGDYYDMIPMNDGSGKWIVIISDASGHGPSGAVIVAMLDALLYSLPQGIATPGAILAHINEYICVRAINNSFVTAFCGVYDPKTRTLDYASAGHNMPLLRGKDGVVRMFLPTGGVPLGVVPQYEFKESHSTLEPGESMLLYTDGITEAESPKRLQFREARLMDSFSAAAASPADEIAAILEAVRAHEGGRPPADDQSMLLIRAI